MDHSIPHQEEVTLTLFYDGNCPMCTQAVSTLKKTACLNKVQAVAWQSGLVNHPDIEERIKSEVVLFNHQAQTYQSGIQALVQLLRIHNQYQLFTGLFRIPGIIVIAQQCYKIVSLNRRIISPNGPMACACDPPFSINHYISLWAILLSIITLALCIFIVQLANLYPERSFFETAIQFFISAGSGWAVSLIMLFFMLGERYRSFIEQCIVSVSTSTLILIPTSAILWIGSYFNVLHLILLNIALLSLILCHLLIFQSIFIRSKILRFPDWLPWLLIVLLTCVSIPLYSHFRLFQ